MTISETPENRADDRGASIRQTFLLHPGEEAAVDYKDGQKFVSGEEFSLKLIKQILGMANAGGGFLVIGYPENPTTKHPEPGVVSAEVLASYDLSSLASSVESCKAGTEKMDIRVHKDEHPKSGQVYPIIEVRGFKSRPFFCSKSAGQKKNPKGTPILEAGALYIRIPSARTVKVASPDEWEQIMEQCIAQRQDEVVRRVGDLIKHAIQSTVAPTPAPSSAPSASPSVPPKKSFDEWVAEVRADVQAETKTRGIKFQGIEIAHSVLDSGKTWDVRALLAAARGAALKNTGWPIGYVFNVAPHKPQPYKKGLRAVIVPEGKDSFDYWFIDADGSFYFFRSYQEDGKRSFSPFGGEQERPPSIWFDTNIWRITEGMEHALSLYRTLGVENTSKIGFRLAYFGIKDRQLTVSPNAPRILHAGQAGNETYDWSTEATIDAFAVSLDQNVIEASDGLFVMFDMTTISPAVIQSVIDEYRGKPKRQ